MKKLLAEIPRAEITLVIIYSNSLGSEQEDSPNDISHEEATVGQY